jgi:RimJ/RimL family protein N-acetyltransferase
VPIRFPIKTLRLIIRPMQLNDAQALLAVYGDAETMQHLNSELPSNVEEAREWVQTKIDLFDRDGQLSLWTVISLGLGKSSVMSACSVKTTAPVRWSVSADEAIGSSGVKGWASRQPSRPSLLDLSSWVSKPSVLKLVLRIFRPRPCLPSWA